MDDNQYSAADQQSNGQKNDSPNFSLEGAIETIANPETSEKEPVYENLVAPVAEAIKEAEKTSSLAPTVDNQPMVSNVVDMRSPQKTHAVNPDAQGLTKDADKKEEDFIEHVDEIHSIKS